MRAPGTISCNRFASSDASEVQKSSDDDTPVVDAVEDETCWNDPLDPDPEEDEDAPEELDPAEVVEPEDEPPLLDERLPFEEDPLELEFEDDEFDSALMSVPDEE